MVRLLLSLLVLRLHLLLSLVVWRWRVRGVVHHGGVGSCVRLWWRKAHVVVVVVVLVLVRARRRCRCGGANGVLQRVDGGRPRGSGGARGGCGVHESSRVRQRALVVRVEDVSEAVEGGLVLTLLCRSDPDSDSEQWTSRQRWRERRHGCGRGSGGRRRARPRRLRRSHRQPRSTHGNALQSFEPSEPAPSRPSFVRSRSRPPPGSPQTSQKGRRGGLVRHRVVDVVARRPIVRVAAVAVRSSPTPRRVTVTAATASRCGGKAEPPRPPERSAERPRPSSGEIVAVRVSSRRKRTRKRKPKRKRLSLPRPAPTAAADARRPHAPTVGLSTSTP